MCLGLLETFTSQKDFFLASSAAQLLAPFFDCWTLSMEAPRSLEASVTL